MNKTIKFLLTTVVIFCVIAWAVVITMPFYAEPFQNETVNTCGHTMEEANKSIYWTDGVYAPEGC